MAFSVHRTLTRLLRSSPSSAARGFCLPSSSSILLNQGQLECHLWELRCTLPPSVLSLETFFVSPAGDRETHHIGTGVVLGPSLIATSARAVGRVTAFFEPRVAAKPDRFDHGGIRHEADIGTTVARTVDGVTVETEPWAVNFGYDVALLKVVKPEGELFHRPCALATSAPVTNDVLSTISRHGFSGSPILLGHARDTRHPTTKAKAPWPLDDRSSEWLEQDWYGLDGPKPPALSQSREKLTGSISKMSGSPLFNMCAEVVGIASWEVEVEVTEWGCFVVGFAAPSSWVRTVLDYAKSKGPEDPIVMDRWVSARVGP